MNKIKALIVLTTILLTGCENTTYPLVFVSQNTVGLEVSGPSADNPGGGSIVVGYKSRDAALVPTGVIMSDEDKKYKVLTLLNGCANDGIGSGNGSGEQAKVEHGDCSAHVTRLQLAQAQELSSAVQADLNSIVSEANRLKDQETNAQIKAKLTDLADPKKTSGLATEEQAVELMKTREMLQVSDLPDVQNLADKLREVEDTVIRTSVTARRATRVDSYSVFSSFNAAPTGKVGDGELSAGLSLGKLFATGVAAQHLGSGMGDNLRNLAASKQMSKAEALAGCVNLLKAENGGNSKPGDTDKCLNFLSVMADSTPAAAIPEISVADATASEGAGTLTFELTRSPGIGISKVSYTANDVSAVAATDYNAATGDVTFSDGEVKKTVDITLIDNAAQDGDKTLDLVLTVTQNAVLKKAQARGTITDDD